MEKCRNWPTDQGLRRQEGKEARLEKGGDYKDSYPDWREVMVLVETLEKKIVNYCYELKLAGIWK